ncbi:MAG: hypothetical protein E7170_03805 [Firmicutes bacterium]|nr:hypothetical protein [Bacillota bacterium]
MKKENIYVGKIAECKNVKRYLKDGERTFIPEFESRTMQMGISFPNIELKNDQAILIKTKKGYINLRNIKKISHAILVNMGFSLNEMRTIPKKDGELFVLEDTLVPYYNKNTDKHVFVKQLRKQVLMDPRIKSGIEH